MTAQPVLGAGHQTPPLKLGISTVRQAAEYWLTPDRFIRRCVAAGDRIIMQFPGTGPVFGLSNPSDIKRLYAMPAGSTELGSAVNRFAPQRALFGETSIIALDGQPHRHTRRLLTPPFLGEALRSYADVMVARTNAALDEWAWKSTVSMRAAMAPVALDIAMQAIFGVTDQARLDRVREASLAFMRIAEMNRFAVDTIVATLRGGRWTGNYDYVLRRRHAVERIIQEEIDERRRTGDLERIDVLGLLLATRDEVGEPMSDIALLENLVGLLVAGYETTALTLAWLAVFVSRDAAVIDELESRVANDDDHYVDAVIKEVLRIRPPGVFSVRYITGPLELDGAVLPAGSTVATMIAPMQRRADLYPDPDRFDPNRFALGQVSPHAWLPFGGGNRRCLGAPFAMLELRLILKTMLQRARIRPTESPHEPMKRSNILLVPAHGGLITLDPR